MRVIAGAARRTVLSAPKGQSTRPTADRIKENLFNILAPDVPGARFLDLFCGSGAIGIEALSRGADMAVFVDSNREAVAVTGDNLARVRLGDKARVMHMCALKAISQLQAEGYVFDIVYLDPPYGARVLEQALTALCGILADGAIVVTETAKDENISSPLPLLFEREYGNTRLQFYAKEQLS